MAITWPAKNNYATGDVLTATNMNGIGDDLNALFDNSFYAGKNKIINGDFGIWQRGTTTNLTASTTTYLADRFYAYMDTNAGTFTYSQQTFTAGTAPVAGYEGAYFMRLSTGGNCNMSTGQRIEDVRTFAGQTVTLSFWAKTSTAKTFTLLIRQNFGSGGSGNVDITSTYTTSTSWQRFTFTTTLGSLTGKTIGTGSYLEVQPITYGAQTGNFTMDFWGFQLEAGSTATPFQTATGTKQGELAACQRYYYRAVAPSYNISYGMGQAYSTTQMFAVIPFPVPLRTQPTALEQTGTAADYRVTSSVFGSINGSSVPAFNSASVWQGTVTLAVSAGLVAGNASALQSTNTGAYLGWSAEL